MDLIERHRLYVDLLRSMPVERGDWRRGEIELVTEPERFIAHEQRLMARARTKGQPEGFGHVGVMYENPWFICVMDPVLFPPKKGDVPIEGSYIRMIYRGNSNGQNSLAIIPLLPDGRLLLNLCYRRPSGQWKLELAGTITLAGEILDSAMRRCVVEELGSKIIEVLPLGDMAPERGLVGAHVPLFLVKIEEPSAAHSDFTVDGHVRLTVAELERAYLEGFLKIEDRSYICNDSYTGFALLQAKLRGLL